MATERFRDADCPTCGQRFALSPKQVNKTVSGLAVYCSRRCAARSNARKSAASMHSRECAHCDASFIGHHLARYCSKTCKSSADKQQRMVDGVCEECYGTFYARRSSKTRFCSRSCAAFNTARCRTGRERTSGPLVFLIDPLEHIGLVVAVSKRFVPFRPRKYGSLQIEETDVFQDGCVGLLHACARFDKSKGVRFSTFAWYYIRGYILHGKNDWRRSQVADAYLTKRCQV